MDIKLGFIGFGKMANAICKGIVSSNYIETKNIYAYDTNTEWLKKSTSELGINFSESYEKLMEACDAILIATKPFVINDVLENIKAYADNKLIISILAGITIETYEKTLTNSRIVRVMPNTPAMVNEGMSVVSGGSKSTKDDVDFVYKMFLNLGKAEILTEDKINAVTAVSGSGPAFYYYIIDIIAHAGEKLGLPYEVSLKLSAQTALGAAKMILETGIAPNDLITAVTTPNGTTAEGNKVLIESDIKEVLSKTIENTNKRAIELGKKK